MQQRNLNGGPEEDRTPDLRIANATLSQLSYRPIELAPELYLQIIAYKTNRIA